MLNDVSYSYLIMSLLIFKNYMFFYGFIFFFITNYKQINNLKIFDLKNEIFGIGSSWNMDIKQFIVCRYPIKRQLDSTWEVLVVFGEISTNIPSDFFMLIEISFVNHISS